ncbi:MAG: hypothetical protein WCG21_11015 [Eubacteriales bacterium]
MNQDTASGIFYTLFFALYAAFGILLIIILCIALLVSIGLFLAKAFGFYRIAQRKGIEHAWIAWIPFAQAYLYAEIIGEEITIGTVKIPQFPWVYIAITYGSPFIAFVLSLIPFWGGLLALLLGPAIYVAGIYVMYRFFKIFEGENAVVYTVISAIFPVVFPIMVLILREKSFAADASTAI